MIVPPCEATEYDNITILKIYCRRMTTPLRPNDVETSRNAERDRDDRLREILLVGVPMRAHLSTG